jgi:Holliday junction resolvase-like predicted endonuclease
VQSLKKQLKKQSERSILDVLSTQNTKSEVVGQRLTSPSRIGDIAEHYAITWLWDEGFEVFHNCGCSGAIDIVAIKDNEIYLFDVKTLTYSKQRGYHLLKSKRTDLQKEMGVQLLSFNPKTRKLRLIKHQE